MTKKLSRTKVKRATKVRTSKSPKVKRSRARSARKSPKARSARKVKRTKARAPVRVKARSVRKSPKVKRSKARSARKSPKVKRTKTRAPVRVKSPKVRRSKSRSAPKVKRTKSPKVKRTSRKSPKARSAVRVTSRVRISKVLPPFNPIYNHPTIAPTYPIATIAPALPIYASVSDLQNAINLRSIYYPGYEFPQWVIDPNLWKFKETIVFYEKEYNLADINKLVIQREPVNMAMKRHYDQEKMFRTFGWRTGSNEIKPNIAIYCNAHIYYKWQNVILDNVHVINLIGFSLERGQPDRKIFVDSNGKLNYDMLIASYNKMWQKLVACAKILKNSGKIKSVRIFAVGAAAFAGGFFSESTFIKNILTPSFLPCFRDLKNADITVSGCNYVDGTFDLEDYWIPNNLFGDPDVHTTLYVNAWDPWSIIGNGNKIDRSLDGFWGRSSNMSVLGWGVTNKHMKFQPV